MKSMEEILRADNCFFKSEIEGLSDLIWSMDILREDGEGALYDYMLTLPS